MPPLNEGSKMGLLLANQDALKVINPEKAGPLGSVSMKHMQSTPKISKFSDGAIIPMERQLLRLKRDPSKMLSPNGQDGAATKDLMRAMLQPHYLKRLKSSTEGLSQFQPAANGPITLAKQANPYKSVHEKRILMEHHDIKTEKG